MPDISKVAFRVATEADNIFSSLSDRSTVRSV